MATYVRSGAGKTCCASPQWSFVTMRCENCGTGYLYSLPDVPAGVERMFGCNSCNMLSGTDPCQHCGKPIIPSVQKT